MVRRFDLSRRLEATVAVNDPRSSSDALRACVGDPLWFLARQWRLGEHRGSDRAFPTAVAITTDQVPVTGASEAAEDDPRVTPPEAVIESEPEQWWTIGRRIRIGEALAHRVPTRRRDDPELQIPGLPAPYDDVHGSGFDGLALYRDRASLRIADARFAELGVPLTEPSDDWRPEALHYDAELAAGPVTLHIPGHRGDDVDWFSVSASGPELPEDCESVELRAHPSRVTYPGAPVPRWWQISDARFDPGAVAPHRTHLASLLMIHVVSSHGDDWFTVPVVVPTGTLVRARSFEIVDSMGLSTTGETVSDWSLFRITGLPEDVALVWPTAHGVLTGPAPLDEVLVGVDEDANLLWAIERRTDGVELATSPPPTERPDGPQLEGQVGVTRARRFVYRPSTTLLPHWHPYVLTEIDDRRVFVQARLADLDRRPVESRPGPTSRLLSDPAAGPDDPAHVLDPSVIPPRGRRLVRQYRLARRTDGLPILWIERRSAPLPAAPASSLRFDLLEEDVEIVTPNG